MRTQISKDYKYFGYTALIENENQNRYMILVGFVNEDNNSKYIAKSLKFTKECGSILLQKIMPI